MSTKTKEQISFNMKQVKNKDSDIEIIISRYLSKEATPEEIKISR